MHSPGFEPGVNEVQKKKPEPLRNGSGFFLFARHANRKGEPKRKALWYEVADDSAVVLKSLPMKACVTVWRRKRG
jgi:ribosomal protein S27AE